MVLRRFESLASVSCSFGEDTGKPFQVIKRHRPPGKLGTLLLQLLQNLQGKMVVWVFTSHAPGPANDSASDQQLFCAVELFGKAVHARHVFRQSVADLKLRPLWLVGQYGACLGLSSEQQTMLTEYMALFSIIRKCCGQQMSAGWRSFLHRIGRDIGSNPGNLTSKSGVHYHECAVYNIPAIEHMMLHSRLVRRLKDQDGWASVSHALLSPSLADSKLNGSYCETCNRNVAMIQLQPKQQCV
jgi:hypothetical protein